jgi:hypothetical protein
MTKEEILNMPAGREMDALVAEKVFGYKINWDGGVWYIGIPEPVKIIPSYSTSISAAIESEEKIRIEKLIPEYVDALNLVIEYDNISRGKLLIQEKQWLLIHANSHQRCRAALLAVKENK